jgi:hypothetical protein
MHLKTFFNQIEVKNRKLFFDVMQLFVPFQIQQNLSANRQVLVQMKFVSLSTIPGSRDD